VNLKMLLSVESLDFSRQRGSKTYKMLKKTLPQQLKNFKAKKYWNVSTSKKNEIILGIQSHKTLFYCQILNADIGSTQFKHRF